MVGAPGSVRALIDANLLINVLLSSDPQRSAAASLLAEAARETFVLVVPPEALEEVARVVVAKPWLASRISPDRADALMQRVHSVAEVLRRLEGPLPRVCRDAEDDYLLAHAVLAQVAFLITRDRDLLDLGEVSGVRIVDPAVFLTLLRTTVGGSDGI